MATTGTNVSFEWMRMEGEMDSESALLQLPNFHTHALIHNSRFYQLILIGSFLQMRTQYVGLFTL